MPVTATHHPSNNNASPALAHSTLSPPTGRKDPHNHPPRNSRRRTEKGIDIILYFCILYHPTRFTQRHPKSGPGSTDLSPRSYSPKPRRRTRINHIPSSIPLPTTDSPAMPTCPHLQTHYFTPSPPPGRAPSCVASRRHRKSLPQHTLSDVPHLPLAIDIRHHNPPSSNASVNSCSKRRLLQRKPSRRCDIGRIAHLLTNSQTRISVNSAIYDWFESMTVACGTPK